MSLTRQEFEDVLKSLFYPIIFNNSDFSYDQMSLTNDKSLYDDNATKFLRGIGRINYYLTEWDNASTQAEKDAVVGSVSSDLGTASVNPDDAYMWPSLGMFGDVKGPIVLDSFEKSFFTQVDATSTGNSLVMTVPSGMIFIPQCANFTLVNVSGLALVSTMSIGSNASSYNNIVPATLLTGLSSANQTYKVNLSGLTTSVPASGEIYCRVSIASTATVYDVVASISGFMMAQ